jgi:methionyl-tRNA formyltransferase
LVLLGSEVAHNQPLDQPPGTVTEVSAADVTVAAHPGAVRLTRVQPEGRALMFMRDFLAGHRLEPGERLDPIPIDR